MRLFVLYCWIGLAGVFVYIGVLWLLLKLGVSAPLAITLSYCAGGATQFFGNRYFNFRAFERTVMHQGSTYVLISIVNYLLTLAFVTVAVRFAGMSVLLATVLSLPITFPAAYLANRYLTFGAGIMASLKRWRSRKARAADVNSPYSTPKRRS